MLEFGAERRVLDVVDGALEPVLAVDDHPAALGAKVGVVVRPEKQIKYTVALGGDPKKSAHSLLTPLFYLSLLISVTSVTVRTPSATVKCISLPA